MYGWRANTEYPHAEWANWLVKLPFFWVTEIMLSSWICQDIQVEQYPTCTVSHSSWRSSFSKHFPFIFITYLPYIWSLTAFIRLSMSWNSFQLTNRLYLLWMGNSHKSRANIKEIKMKLIRIKNQILNNTKITV